MRLAVAWRVGSRPAVGRSVLDGDGGPDTGDRRRRGVSAHAVGMASSLLAVGVPGRRLAGPIGFQDPGRSAPVGPVCSRHYCGPVSGSVLAGFQGLRLARWLSAGCRARVRIMRGWILKLRPILHAGFWGCFGGLADFPRRD